MVNGLKQWASGNCVEIGLEVIPGSKQFRIMGFNPWTNALKIKVRQKALEGRANRELIEELEKLFHARTEILSGEKGRKKRILVRDSLPAISQIIANACKP